MRIPGRRLNFWVVNNPKAVQGSWLAPFDDSGFPAGPAGCQPTLRFYSEDAGGEQRAGEDGSVHQRQLCGCPTGTVKINNGAAATGTKDVNKVTPVTLNLAATDANGVSLVGISNTVHCDCVNSFGTTKPYAAVVPWTSDSG